MAEDSETTLGTDKFGTTWSAKINSDGTQVWAQTRNGEIINGGLNLEPRDFNPGKDCQDNLNQLPGGDMNLTRKQAYMAMFYYLENLYDMTQSDDLGGFLSGMMMLEDGKPADPAAWSDWERAVKKALDEVPNEYANKH